MAEELGQSESLKMKLALAELRDNRESEPRIMSRPVQNTDLSAETSTQPELMEQHL